MPKIRVTTLKEYLHTKTYSELIDEVVMLFQKYDVVKEYYTNQITGTHSDTLLEAHKKIIAREFSLKRGDSLPRLSIARKAVLDYKKASQSIDGHIDLMLYYVEQGIAFTNEFGDINASFYSSLESMFEQAIKTIVKGNRQEECQTRCAAIVQNTRHIGWGFHDQLQYIYEQVYRD